MKTEMRKPTTVDEYFASAPPEAIKALTQIRKTLKQHLPKEAVEVISYDIPAFKWNGTPLYYAGWKTHVSIYPIPKGNAVFQKLIEPHKAGKGTLKFKLSEPLPADLIVAIAKQRVANDAVSYTSTKTTAKKPTAKKTTSRKVAAKTKPRSAKSK